MHPVADKTIAALRSSSDRAAATASRFDRRVLAWGGLALAAVTFLAVNLLGANVLRSWRGDFTSEGIYTISDGTRKALSAIDEPIDMRVYFTKRLGEVAPTYLKNFERVRTLLEQYRSLSGNKLRVTYLDPVPFSDAEDRAVASGLQGVRLNQDGDVAYFGLTGTNSTDTDGSIPFFSPQRERFIEYDVTKLIYSLANPKKPIVGLLSSIQVDGGLNPSMGMRGQPIPPQVVMQQIREVFDVRTLEKGDLKEIPKDIDVLMLVQPTDLTPEVAYAVDQFALKGGKVLAFVDPVSESSGANPMMPPASTDPGEFGKVLASWGLAYDFKKIAGDITHARRVQFGSGMRANVTNYVAWLNLDKRNLDARDVTSGGIERLNMATVGALTKRDKATTTVSAVLSTSDQAMLIDADKAKMQPDPVGLLRAYKPGGTSIMLAARVSGETASAFPDGAPKPKEDEKTSANNAGKDDNASKSEPAKDAKTEKPDAKPAATHLAKGNVNVLVIADTDILYDRFWVDVREFLGQQVAVPHAHNAAFVVGALENLTGSDALISLRGRGVTDRPFELVEDIRRESEQKFREKEQALTAKLKELQDKLAKLEKTGDGQSVILTDKDRQTIEQYRTELLGVRRELRNVKLALRQDIDRLDGWLKFANIGLVPLMIGLGGMGWAWWRRRNQKSKTAR